MKPGFIKKLKLGLMQGGPGGPRGKPGAPQGALGTPSLAFPCVPWSSQCPSLTLKHMRLYKCPGHETGQGWTLKAF